MVATTENKKTEPMVLYSNDINDYDQLRNEYLEDCKENDIEPEDNGEFAYHSQMCCDAWNDFKDYTLPNLEDQAEHFLAVGSSGTWQGRRDGGKLSKYLKTIIEGFVNGLDNITISYDSDSGSLELSGSHHDGSNSYTVYALNGRAERSIESAESVYDDTQSRWFHEKLDKKYYHRKLACA